MVIALIKIGIVGGAVVSERYRAVPRALDSKAYHDIILPCTLGHTKEILLTTNIYTSTHISVRRGKRGYGR